MSGAPDKLNPAGYLHWSDKALAGLFPGWARRRAEARLRLIASEQAYKSFSTYEAAAKTRETADWAWTGKSANQEIVPDSATINGRARRAVDNNWAAASAIGAYKRHLAGIGITAKASARDPHASPSDRTRDPSSAYEVYNRQLDARWFHWTTHPRLIDIERRKGMTSIQRLMVADFSTVGQSLLLFSMEPRASAPGLVLQVCETEQLATGRITPRNKGAQIVGGIEVDAYGAPLGYWMSTQAHPLEDYQIEPTYVDAERVCQFMDPHRVRQVYGVSKLAPSLKKLWHLEMYDEYQLIRARLEACICAILVENKASNGPMALGVQPTAEQGTTDARGSTVERLEPGLIKRIQANSGEDIKFLDPTTPGNNYDPFVTNQIAQAAAGTMMDFAVVAREYRRATYSSQREARLERGVEISTLQLLFIEQVLQPTREEFIRVAILQGLLTPPPGYWQDAMVRQAAMATEWRPPPKIGIDPAKDAVAAKIQFELGLATLRDKLNEIGLDWRETLEQIAAEKDMAEELGLNIGWLLKNVDNVTVAMPDNPVDPNDDGGGDGGGNNSRRQQSRHSGGNGNGIPDWMAEVAMRD